MGASPVEERAMDRATKVPRIQEKLLQHTSELFGNAESKLLTLTNGIRNRRAELKSVVVEDRRIAKFNFHWNGRVQLVNAGNIGKLKVFLKPAIK